MQSCVCNMIEEGQIKTTVDYQIKGVREETEVCYFKYILDTTDI